MYRFKERSAPRYFGVPDDLLYHASSGIYQTAAFAAAPESYFLQAYNAGMARRGTSVYSPYESGKERISWQSGTREIYNPCHHARSRVVNYPFGAWHDAYGYGGYMTYYEPYYRFPGPPNYPYDLGILQHPNVDYQAARARAWHNMQPRFEGKVSCINFLYELKDFRDIVKYVFKKERALKDIRKLFSRKRPKLSPKDPTSGIATGILVNNFAIQPLIKDLAAMMQQANIIVREAQQQFLESGSDFQKSQYTEEIHRIDKRYTGNYNNAWVANGYMENTLFTATLRYKYDYTMRDTIDAWMKYWGFCGSFEAWWNMIPFSFLVDYFVQIGNSIHAMEHDPNVRLNEYEYGESLKSNFMYGTSTSGSPILTQLVIDGNVYIKSQGDRMKDRLLSGLEGSLYTRALRTPYYGPATPRLKLPSTTQTLNMGALLRCLF